MTRAALTEADRVIAACRCDAVGIKNFLWALDELKELVDLDDVVIVANRVPSGCEREISDLLRRHTGKRPAACVPDRPGEFAAALEVGCALGQLKPGSDVVRAVREAAAAAGGSVRARGFLMRLAGRS